MEKGRKITAPDWCKIEKVELIDGVAVVTFRKKEWKLPKSWEEFCKNYPVKAGEWYISGGSCFLYSSNVKRECKAMLPDRATAEAVLALMQLIQLRNAFNGDWVPDWTDKELKFVIHLDGGELKKFDWYYTASSPLYFKSVKLRDEFLRCFRPLIEKLKPLYGIKEGGEKC